ncbi:hypothetical protein ILUMI_00472 [Ignelater luminosus]|uniref:Uncharacterized protein n=1 Tax=Ignelater luminosus TaxID=2038154 RepID=A0A8K0DM84_IGNLU|nr:hypothetical protein ILUMI_00472 [Ignelater luminosus]
MQSLQSRAPSPLSTKPPYGKENGRSTNGSPSPEPVTQHEKEEVLVADAETPPAAGGYAMYQHNVLTMFEELTKSLRKERIK